MARSTVNLDDPFAGLGPGSINLDSPFADMKPPVKSRAQQLNEQFQAMPWYSKLGQSADDMVRIGADGVSFGYGDKLSAYLNSLGGRGVYDKNLDAERKATDDARLRAGMPGQIADAAGMVSSATLSPSLKVLQKAPTVARYAGGILSNILEGAGMGTLGALGHDTSVDEGMKTGAISGGIGGAAVPVATGILSKALKPFDKVVPRRTQAELKAAKDAAYKQVENSGAAYEPKSLQNMVMDLELKAAQKNINPRIHPNAWNTIQGIGEDVFHSGGALPVNSVDQLRQFAARDIGGSPAEDQFRSLVTGHIDDYINNAGPRDMAAGTSQDAIDAITKARDLNRRYKKTETVNDALYKGENAAANSEGRAQLRTVLNSDEQMRGFTGAERQAMEEVVRGSPTVRSADALQRVMPKSFVGGSIAGGVLGSMLGGVPGAVAAMAIPAIGAGARGVRNAGTRASVNSLLDTIDGSASRTPNVARVGLEASTPSLMRAVPGLSLADPLGRSRAELERRRKRAM